MSKIKRVLSILLTACFLCSTFLSTVMVAHASMLPLKEETVYLILNKETNEQLKEMKMSTILGKLQDSNGNLVSIDGEATTVWHYSKDAESGLETYESYLVDGSDGKSIDLSQPTGANMQIIELIVGKDGQLNDENIRYIVKVYYTGYNNNITYELYSQSADGTKRTKIEPLKKTYTNGSYDKIIDINGNPIAMFNAVYSVPEGDIINPYLGIKCSIDERPDVRVEFYELTDRYLTNPITDELLNQDMTKINSGYKMTGASASFIIRFYIDGMDAGVQVYNFMIAGSFPYVSSDLFEIKSGTKESVVCTTTEDVDFDNDVYTFKHEVNEGESSETEYYLNLKATNGDVDLSSNVVKAVVGHYDSLSEVSSLPDIKSQLFSSSSGYKADYSGDGVDFSLFFEDGVIYDNIPYKLTIKTVEYASSMREFTDKPIIGEADPWLRVMGASSASGKEYDTYVIENGKNINMDTYYGYGYQTVFINEPSADLTNIEPTFWYANTNRVYAVSKDTGDRVEEGHTRNFNDENQQYTGVIIDKSGKENDRNYWVTFKKLNNNGAELFVYGPNEREVILDEYFEFKHDILIANIGNAPLKDISVKLVDAENVKLDPYWTVGGDGNDTLAAFTTTSKNTQYGELANLGKIRLLPDGDGEVKGTLIITAKGQEPVMITLNGTAQNPEIITDTLDEAVKYVPYQHIIATNNMHDWVDTKFSVSEGQLPNGITLNSETGEIYGVPTVPSGASEETYTFTVEAKYLVEGQEGYFNSSEKEFSITVKPNTDENVYLATDDSDGYYIEEHIGTEDGQYHYVLEVFEDTVFKSNGEFGEFKYLWLNGEKLVDGEDYTKEEGSTKITIKSQTLENKVNKEDTNTIAMEFRKDDNGDGKGDDGAEMNRTSQNFVVKEQVPEETAVDKVIKKINSLPTNITLSDKSAVQSARSAYNALSQAEKNQVTNYSKLTAAENTIKALEEAAANQVAADKVIAKIKAIPSTITSDAKDEIQAARTAYNALTDAQKKLVTNYEKLTAAETALAKYEAQQADKEKANKVVALISAIPSTITSDAKDEIQTARAAYNALSESQKSYVTNYKRLTDAETALKQYESQQADKEKANKVVALISAIPSTITSDAKDEIQAARAAYDALSESQKSYVTNYKRLTDAEAALKQYELQQEQIIKDKNAANKVISLIDALPENITLNDKADVNFARTAYNALTASQKGYVTNYNKLTSAEEKIIKLENEAQEQAKVNAVIVAIDSIPENLTLKDKTKVESARTAYNALTSEQKEKVVNYNDLLNAEKAIDALEAQEEANKADKEAADKVISMINNLPDNVELSDKTAVESVRNAYNNLTSNQKKLVSNISKLVEAEETIKTLEEYEEASKKDKAAADEVIKLINALPSDIKLDDKSSVEEARAAYEALTENQKKIVTNYDVLTNAEVKIAELEDEKHEEVQYVTFVGILVDKDGNAYSDKIVEIHSVVQTGRTDKNGSFQFNNVEFGKHTISVKDENGNIVAQREFNISLGAPTGLNGNDIIAENGDTFTVKMQVDGNEINFLSLEEGNKAPIVDTDDTKEDEPGIDIGEDETPDEDKTDEGIDIGEEETPKDDEGDDGIYIGEDGKGNDEDKKPTTIPDSVPDTGDESNIILWTVVLIISLAGLVVTSAIGIKDKKRARQF